ncbi:Gfo/Idh/MocA family oxidoreductase [Mesorhizobium sp. M00.F.Ca.ET.186.01.1.1]|nr:Gfo/Idh/MocA family oxidoreductase [bacterium M00.F.Ca.ET.205.01.1.1]TGU52704.1 Gfo/Idh/MocA family oxidoreductase [bacterium M00.F.Ca.ET.152.01.1.1]TGV35682.1 Gfo/Idh/MocA family oxidoreductase [Mesorhizobium sp. M00.F.Ca.ET.186.01.1.1]TGZ43256.1 Gfo/Idh/MocA family oxidoreductase [bacterium M00.F.Ca.ET.162.01.1.1]
MSRIRVGVIGAGMISQVEHIPNLLRLGDLFELVGVADPSRISRQFVTDTHGVPGFETPEQLFDQRLDAVVIGSPDPLHYEQVLTGLARGLHVFCEKPLCYSPAEISDIIAARDKAGKVMQVGTMKRFDPSYRLALASLPGMAKTLRSVSVEVNDPDAWPFIAHHPYRRGSDIPKELIASAIAKQKDQVEHAIGQPLTDLAFRGFTGAYSSALIHDVNAVHGLLDALEVPDGEIVGAQIFANGDGGQGAVKLLGGQALWTMTHLTVPKLADYKERITLFFDDASLELEFPSPWLNHHPTRLTVKTSDGHTLSTRDLRAGYGEAFVEELRGFWGAMVNGDPVVNRPEHAARDQALLVGLTRRHLAASPAE